jgi:hypothetical protein
MAGGARWRAVSGSCGAAARCAGPLFLGVRCWLGHACAGRPAFAIARVVGRTREREGCAAEPPCRSERLPSVRCARQARRRYVVAQRTPLPLPHCGIGACARALFRFCWRLRRLRASGARAIARCVLRESRAGRCPAQCGPRPNHRGTQRMSTAGASPSCPPGMTATSGSVLRVSDQADRISDLQEGAMASSTDCLRSRSGGSCEGFRAGSCRADQWFGASGNAGLASCVLEFQAPTARLHFLQYCTGSALAHWRR